MDKSIQLYPKLTEYEAKVNHVENHLMVGPGIQMHTAEKIKMNWRNNKGMLIEEIPCDTRETMEL